MTEDDEEKVEGEDEGAPKEEEETPKEGEEKPAVKEGGDDNAVEEAKEGGDDGAVDDKDEEKEDEGKEDEGKEDEGDAGNVKTTTETTSDGKIFTTYGKNESPDEHANADTDVGDVQGTKSKAEIKEESDSADNFYQDAISESVELWAMIDPSLHNLVLNTQIIPGQIKYIYDLFEDGLALIDDKVFLSWAHRQLIVIKVFFYVTNMIWPIVLASWLLDGVLLKLLFFGKILVFYVFDKELVVNVF